MLRSSVDFVQALQRPRDCHSFHMTRSRSLDKFPKKNVNLEGFVARRILNLYLQGKMNSLFGQIRGLRCIFDVKDAPCTGRPVVENVDKITEIIEVDRHVSSRSIAQELTIDHKTVLNPFAQSWIQKEAPCLGATPINTKKHDGTNFHL
ncbi:hypothetical protein TNCV_403801 [Trichonephila clavipes]|nr:hypothetical protein TNCV_403801 [Trichonephila clavipes]